MIYDYRITLRKHFTINKKKVDSNYLLVRLFHAVLKWIYIELNSDVVFEGGYIY